MAILSGFNTTTKCEYEDIIAIHSLEDQTAIRLHSALALGEPVGHSW